MSVANYLRDFYSICPDCGRMGHDRVLPESRAEVERLRSTVTRGG